MEKESEFGPVALISQEHKDRHEVIVMNPNIIDK